MRLREFFYFVQYDGIVLLHVELGRGFDLFENVTSNLCVSNDNNTVKFTPLPPAKVSWNVISAACKIGIH